jgi:hypothetical protein
MAMTSHTHAVRETRDPEDRIVDRTDCEATREKMFDKTMADSFPASDPPSSLPDPSEDSFALAWSPLAGRRSSS